MIGTILVAFGALMAGTFAGALLAPADDAARHTRLRSQWSTRQMPPAAPRCDSHAC